MHGSSQWLNCNWVELTRQGFYSFFLMSGDDCKRRQSRPAASLSGETVPSENSMQVITTRSCAGALRGFFNSSTVTVRGTGRGSRSISPLKVFVLPAGISTGVINGIRKYRSPFRSTAKYQLTAATVREDSLLTLTETAIVVFVTTRVAGSPPLGDTGVASVTNLASRPKV